MIYRRLIGSAILASIFTLGTFWLMTGLVGDAEGGQLSDSHGGIHFGPVDLPESLTTKVRTPPPQFERPPARPETRIGPKSDPVKIAIPNLNIRSFGDSLNGLAIQTGQVFSGGNLLSGQPVKKLTLAPQYPLEPRMRGIEGRVTVRFMVNAAGSVENIQILNASPPRVFDRAVIAALRRWQYQPAVVDGVAVAREVTEVIEFLLEGD